MRREHAVQRAHEEDDDGSAIGYDALLLTPGATMIAVLDHAMTWTPEAAPEIFAGLLRDMDQGYLKRLAFVVPEGPSWPLPAFELALMTGIAPVALDDLPLAPAAETPSWWPGRKVAGRYLENYLAARA